MGVSGSGKSTFGQQLAALLSAPYFEGDEFHPPGNVRKMRAGIPLQDADRWPWLDRLAGAFTAACMESHRVVGACSALKRVYRDRLRERIPVPVLFICLEASQEVLIARLTSRRGHYMPPALLASQLATLQVPDASELALRLDSTRPSDDLIMQAAAMLRKLERHDN